MNETYTSKFPQEIYNTITNIKFSKITLIKERDELCLPD